MHAAKSKSMLPGHDQSHPARRAAVCWQELPHIIIGTPLFGPLYELAARPDLQWFVASAYYILAVVAPSGSELDAATQKCIEAPWVITTWFSTFEKLVHAAGIPLYPTNTGCPDFTDGRARVNCSLHDKVLLLLVLMFGTTTEWVHNTPLCCPEPVFNFIALIRNWTGRRFPLAHF